MARKKSKKRRKNQKYIYYRDANGYLRRRKVKRSYKRLKRMIIAFLVIVIAGVYAISQRDSLALQQLGYSRKERKVLLAKSDDELDEYLSLNYAIDMDAWDEYSNNGYYYDYELYESMNPDLAEISVIHYVDDFYNVFNELEILGFTKDFCRKKWNDWSIDDFNMFSDYRIDYDSVKKYLSYDEAILSDLPEYMDSDYDGIEAVMNVSYPFVDSGYSTSDTYYVEEPDNLGILVKEGFTIDEYEPDDLVECAVTQSEYGNNMLRQEVATQFEKLVKAAKKAGITLYMGEGYISYDDCKYQYDSYVQELGSVFAKANAGTPGTNEHQTGLAVDVTTDLSTESEFSSTEAYKWLKENAADYGFIIRYPEGKDDITGRKEDNSTYCHLRYVGEDMAMDISDMDMTLEEYILTYGFGYDITVFDEE